MGDCKAALSRSHCCMMQWAPNICVNGKKKVADIKSCENGFILNLAKTKICENGKNIIYIVRYLRKQGLKFAEMKKYIHVAKCLLNQD